VVRADDHRLDVALALQQLVRAVLADVEEGAHHAVVAAQHEQALVDDRRAHIVAGVGQLAFMRHHLPAGIEQALFLPLEHRGVAVKIARQGGRALRIVGKVCGPGEGLHGRLHTMNWHSLNKVIGYSYQSNKAEIVRSARTG
jgi:hypothetical protein